jgi:hypothetical protein
MVKVKVTVETQHSVLGSAWFQYVVHVVNHSQHALRGAVRAGFRKYPNAQSIEAAFVEAA